MAAYARDFPGSSENSRAHSSPPPSERSPTPDAPPGSYLEKNSTQQGGDSASEEADEASSSLEFKDAALAVLVAEEEEVVEAQEVDGREVKGEEDASELTAATADFFEKATEGGMNGANRESASIDGEDVLTAEGVGTGSDSGVEDALGNHEAGECEEEEPEECETVESSGERQDGARESGLPLESTSPARQEDTLLDRQKDCAPVTAPQVSQSSDISCRKTVGTLSPIMVVFCPNVYDVSHVAIPPTVRVSCAWLDM